MEKVSAPTAVERGSVGRKPCGNAHRTNRAAGFLEKRGGNGERVVGPTFQRHFRCLGSVCFYGKRAREGRETTREEGTTREGGTVQGPFSLSLLSSLSALHFSPLWIIFLLCWDDKRERKELATSVHRHVLISCLCGTHSKPKCDTGIGVVGHSRGFLPLLMRQTGNSPPWGSSLQAETQKTMEEGHARERAKGGFFSKPLSCVVPLRGLGSARRCCLGTGEYVI